MQFYEFGDALRPLGEKAPEKWENVLALLEPSELSAVTLPDTLTPPLTSDSVYGSQLCALLTDQNGITGHIRIPARGSQAARRFTFSWSQGNVLIVDHDRVVANCLDAIRAMRPHNADGADNFLADLLLTLVRDDLAALEQLEERITNLEQEVLADNTDRFIHRMSAIRKEVSRADRFYAQLADFGASLLEEADDLFDKRSTRRMNYFLRRVEALKNETERLRLIAQIAHFEPCRRRCGHRKGETAVGVGRRTGRGVADDDRGADDRLAAPVADITCDGRRLLGFLYGEDDAQRTDVVGQVRTRHHPVQGFRKRHRRNIEACDTVGLDIRTRNEQIFGLPFDLGHDL